MSSTSAVMTSIGTASIATMTATSITSGTSKKKVRLTSCLDNALRRSKVQGRHCNRIRPEHQLPGGPQGQLPVQQLRWPQARHLQIFCRICVHHSLRSLHDDLHNLRNLHGGHHNLHVPHSFYVLRSPHGDLHNPRSHHKVQ